MIAITADLEIDPAFDEPFVEAVTALVAATHAEDGCERYEFFRHLTQPGVFHVFEEWASEEALAAHGGSEHMRTFGRAMRGFGVKRAEIFRYDVSAKGPLR
jgi:quinol monooxygenase YgiN